jgi:hypothetical protein
MVDYAQLAGNAKAIQDADKLAAESHKRLRANPCAFFERVKEHIVEEMNKANVELRKMKADTFDRIHMPSFDDEFLLTYGTCSLCRVGLGVIEGECRVTAVISGPPNGYEISRREYLCVQEESCSEVIHLVGEESSTIVACPNEIAADIVTGILAGKFA